MVCFEISSPNPAVSQALRANNAEERIPPRIPTHYLARASRQVKHGSRYCESRWFWSLLYSGADFCLTENMKRSEAAKYARWSATVALVLALGTAGVYVQHGWKARKERLNAPAAAAANILRQSNGVTFSKGEGSRKEFTVEASKSTDFKDRDLTELETVVITIFGKNGDRHDVIHTKSCQYGKADGNVVCSGEVRMDLESAADVERTHKAAAGPASQAPSSQTPVPQVLHVVTK